MDASDPSERKSPELRPVKHVDIGCDELHSRLRYWQQARSWARLIREVENLWHLEARELRRLGAVELSQLFEEIPTVLRPRVNRWLDNYAAATRFNSQGTKFRKKSL